MSKKDLKKVFGGTLLNISPGVVFNVNEANIIGDENISATKSGHISTLATNYLK